MKPGMNFAMLPPGYFLDESDPDIITLRRKTAPLSPPLAPRARPWRASTRPPCKTPETPQTPTRVRRTKARTPRSPGPLYRRTREDTALMYFRSKIRTPAPSAMTVAMRRVEARRKHRRAPPEGAKPLPRTPRIPPPAPPRRRPRPSIAARAARRRPGTCGWPDATPPSTPRDRLPRSRPNALRLRP